MAWDRHLLSFSAHMSHKKMVALSNKSPKFNDLPIQSFVMRLKNQPKGRMVIIGGGIGGLSLGIILAKLAYPVTLVERNKQVGGMMRSYTREGIDCDIGIHYLGSLDKGQVLRRCFDYLGVTDEIPLERMGVNGIIDRYIFANAVEGPDHFNLPEGIDAYAENLKTAFPLETKAIDAFMALLRRSAKQLNDLTFLYHDIPADVLVDQTESLSDVFQRLGCSRALRAVIGIPAHWLGAPAERCPLFFHNMILANYLFSSWRLVQSGAHAADTFANRFRALGGEIITGRSVKHIRIKNGQISKIRLNDEQIIPADGVISTVHPKILLPMLEENTLKASYRDRIRRLIDTPGFFCTQAKIPAAAQSPMPHNLFLIKESKDTTDKDSIFIQLKQTSDPKYHLLTLLGDGKSDLWAPWENTLTGHRGQDYLEMKKEVADKMITQASEFIGPFPSIKLLDTYTPLTIRDWVNSPNGSAYGVMKSSDQLLSAALLNRTAIKGLYLAGQSSMAPGILGTVLGSFATVKSILGPRRFTKMVDIQS